MALTKLSKQKPVTRPRKWTVEIIQGENRRTRKTSNYTFKQVLQLAPDAVAMKFVNKHGTFWYKYTGDVGYIDKMGIGRNSAGHTQWDAFRLNPNVKTQQVSAQTARKYQKQADKEKISWLRGKYGGK